MDVFAQIAFTLVISFGIAAIMMFLRQPLLIGYILAGVIVGPYGLNILSSTETVELFAKLGITALLFIVGLSLSPKVIKELGKVSLITGIGQVIFTSFVGYLISRGLGYPPVESIYIAIALTFSSTIIILKLLSDKGDTQKLYGRIAVGFLLVQDLVATILLVIISSLASSGAMGGNVFLEVLIPLLKGFFALVILMIIGQKILPKLTRVFAKSGELLFIFSVAWGIGIGLLYYELGLSIEIGALVAGIALSITPYSHEISSRMKPLRDFFIVLFFINLGNHLVFDNFAQQIIPTIILSLFIIIGNPLIMYILMNLLGYTRRTSFLTGLTVAQISEFSLILIALGVSVGQVSKQGSSVVTLVGIITIASSTYLIMYGDKVYRLVARALKFIEFRKNNKDKDTKHKTTEAVLFGCDRVGVDFIKALEETKLDFIVVDHNPNIIEILNSKKIPAVYGDADDIEFLDEVNLSKVKLVISTIPDFNTNLFLVEHTHSVNPKAVIIVLSENIEQSQRFYDSGATYVIMPHYVGANIAANMIQEFGHDAEKYQQMGKKHLAYLKRRQEIADLK